MAAQAAATYYETNHFRGKCLMNDSTGKPMTSENPYDADKGISNEPVTEKKSSRSCCLYGCLFLVLFMLVGTIGGGLAGYWWFKGQVNRYTADSAADLPTVELSEAELADVQSRIDKFKETIEDGDSPSDLVLTADEINAMIANDDDLRGRVFVTIEEGQVGGEVSVPTDFLPGGKGRFFNASATFDVSLENGVLIVTLSGAEVKGEKVPPQFIEGMSKENLAKELYKDPEAAATLRRIESISIEHDRIILKPRASVPNAEATSTEETSTEEINTEAVDSAPEPTTGT